MLQLKGYLRGAWKHLSLRSAWSLVARTDHGYKIGLVEQLKFSLYKSLAGRFQSWADDVSKSMHSRAQFRQILPTDAACLHQQLFNNERVHREETVQDMMDKRVGDENANKRVFARTITATRGIRGEKEDISAAIFTALVNVEVENGVPKHTDIPGNITDIKEMPVEAFVPPRPDENKVVFAILYTISSNEKLGYDWEKGGGRSVAENIYDRLYAEAREKGYKLYISTLSPVVENFERDMPDLYERLSAVNFNPSEQQQEELRRDLLRHLLSEKNQVMNFHLGNGAYIGDIKFNFGNPKDPIMVNYVYPADQSQALANKKAYKETKIRPIATHLYRDVSVHMPEFLGHMLPMIRGSEEIPFHPVPVEVREPAPKPDLFAVPAGDEPPIPAQ